MRGALPVGRGLDDDVWNRRHRGIVILLASHVPVLFAYALLTGHSAAFAGIAVLPIITCALVAGRSPDLSRGFQSGVATFGLVTCSALLVHMSNGLIEMHFHFFVMVGVITLYQDWLPFGLALVFVVLHHGVMGALDPKGVYDHSSGQNHPWLWALIHGGFVLAACVAHLLSWRLNEEQALRDGLTHLANRALFAERLRTALARRARFGGPVVVLFIDLDEFKPVNDRLGHHAGDQLLVEVARRLESAVRSVDTVARFGGDEFAVLLEGLSPSEAEQVAHRLVEEIDRPVAVSGGDAAVGASIGLVSVSRESSVDDVLRNADLAMYMAKASGRGRVEVFEDAMADASVSGERLEDDLRAAIEAGAIEVYYQPTVQLDDGEITGFEALARWRHPERGSIPPSEFIPVAEASGLIVPLGEHVLRVACADAAQWRRTNPRITIAVNVSVVQLAGTTLIDDVRGALAASGLAPDALVLELTESVLAQDLELTAARLGELKGLGVRLAIDDFGTGYSSLSYLRHFPIDILKIDRTFVDQLPGDGRALARSIVRLGESMNMHVVAEGIEDEAQRAALTQLGCHHGQGFLFAEARPAPTIADLLGQAQVGRRATTAGARVPGPRLAERRAIVREPVESNAPSPAP